MALGMTIFGFVYHFWIFERFGLPSAFLTYLAVVPLIFISAAVGYFSYFAYCGLPSNATSETQTAVYFVFVLTLPFLVTLVFPTVVLLASLIQRNPSFAVHAYYIGALLGAWSALMSFAVPIALYGYWKYRIFKSYEPNGLSELCYLDPSQGFDPDAIKLSLVCRQERYQPTRFERRHFPQMLEWRAASKLFWTKHTNQTIEQTMAEIKLYQEEQARLHRLKASLSNAAKERPK
jgi:hypothetical protein